MGLGRVSQWHGSDRGAMGIQCPFNIPGGSGEGFGRPTAPFTGLSEGKKSPILSIPLKGELPLLLLNGGL